LFSEIANEKGLDAQNFQCAGCGRAIGLSMYCLNFEIRITTFKHNPVRTAD